jgi:hypothetical protein
MAGFARPHPAQGAQSTRRPVRALFITLGVALLIVAVATLAYLAYRNHWIDLPGSRSQGGPTERSAERTTVIFSGKSDALNAAPGNTIQPGTSDSMVWVASSRTTAKSSGATDGVSVKLPSALVSEIVGKRIRITVSAGRGNTEKLSPFALTYSTGAAGNSGWMVFDPSQEFDDFSFSYVVPRRAAGFTHYVGIWSDISGQETPLAIRRITITTQP